MFRQTMIAVAMACAMAVPAIAQDSDSRNKNLDIRSSVGDLHVGNDADAKKIGLPLYPGARLKTNDNNQDQANLSLFTDAFGMKLVVANYVSNDAASKILDFYRDRMKKYGKVLECHSPNRSVSMHDDDDDKKSEKGNQLTCDGDNTGPVTELKVGTEDNQRVVSVEAGDASKGTNFALVYVYTRGKRGDI